jgi:hypothetical protein
MPAFDSKSFSVASFSPASFSSPEYKPPQEEEERPYPGAAFSIGSSDGLIRIRRTRRRRESDLLFMGN